MESSRASNPISEILQSPRSRLQLIVVAAIVMLGFAIWFNLPKSIETCELVHGCKLNKTDLRRIQVVLSQAGLNDFETTENNIRVPREARDRYIQAIADANALPEELAPRDNGSDSLNPFLSRGQQEQIQIATKKRQVREMVMRLPFVEQAWFEMDRAKSRSSFERDQQSAVVLIRPVDEMLLENSHVETIRGLIIGAIAGIPREDIVVTDLNAGVAFQGSKPDSYSQVASSNKNVHQVSSQEQGQQAYYENAIRKALSAYGDLRIDVSLKQIETRVPVKNLQVSQPKSSRILQVGTNGQAAVARTAPQVKPEFQVRMVEKVLARIGVPESLVLGQLNPPAEVVDAKLREAQGYRVQWTKLKQEIHDKIRGLLPPGSFSDFRNPPIQIDVIEVEDQVVAVNSEVWFEEAFSKVGGLWGGLAILIGAFLIVAFVFSGSRNEVPHEPSPLIADQEIPELQVVSSDEQAIKQEVSRLIKEDPEAAAQVIKRWIRNAA